MNPDPTVGSAIKKSRPCVVVSPSELHDHLKTVIVAPMNAKGFAAPFRVPLTHAGTKGLILLDQVRSVDKVRLAKRLGAVSSRTLGAALATLQEIFALTTKPGLEFSSPATLLPEWDGGVSAGAI